MQGTSHTSKDVWVIIPAYNEESSIGDVLDQFARTNYSVLVVDDCSQDSTASTVLNYPVILLQHSANLGQGAALQTGFDFVTNFTSARYLVTFDSDGQHTVSEVEKLIEPLQLHKCDVTLGSRFLKIDSKNKIPFKKQVVLKLGLVFTRLTTQMKVTDTHNGLRGFTIDAVKYINIQQNRMAHASEILSQISKKNLKWQEVPVTIHYTEYSKKKGQSIFNAFNILWDLLFGKD